MPSQSSTTEEPFLTPHPYTLKEAKREILNLVRRIKSKLPPKDQAVALQLNSALLQKIVQKRKRQKGMSLSYIPVQCINFPAT